jgi:hypothetical protein
MHIICSGGYSELLYDNDDSHFDIDDMEASLKGHHTYTTLQCPKCKKINIIKHYSEDAMDFDIESLIYPEPLRKFQSLPEKIQKSYDSAQKQLVFDPAAAIVYIGKIIQMLCNDKEAKGNTLDKNITYLAEKGIIPKQIEEISHTLRKIRNYPAHSDELDEIEPKDAYILMALCDAILEYVYEAPAKLNYAKKLLKETQNAEKAKNDHE